MRCSMMSLAPNDIMKSYIGNIMKGQLVNYAKECFTQTKKDKVMVMPKYVGKRYFI